MSTTGVAVTVRSWLGRNLFPGAPPPAAGFSSRRALIVVGVAIALMAIQLARMWPGAAQLALGRGRVVLATGRDAPRLIANLTTPYNGYLQTLSRLVAEAVSRLPAAWFAPAMVLCGVTIVAGSALVVWYAAAPHLEHKCVRAALAAMVVLLPVVGVDTLGTLTNSMWFLFFVTFWLLLWRPATNLGAAGVATLAFLAAVSNAGVALLLPLWLLRLIAIRDRRDAMILAAFAGGVAVQLGYSWGDLNRIGEPSTYSTLPVVYRPSWDWSLLPAYTQRIVSGAIGRDTIGGDLWRLFGVPFEIALGWFALSVRQVRALNAASQLIDNPTTERVPAVQRRAASELDAAGLLYPGIEVTLLRAQLAGNGRDYAQAKRLLDQATGAEPDNLAVWLAYFHVQLGGAAPGSALLVVHELRRLDPRALPAGQ